MGQVVGSTTSKGEQPKDKPYSVSQVLATLYQAGAVAPFPEIMQLF